MDIEQKEETLVMQQIQIVVVSYINIGDNFKSIPLGFVWVSFYRSGFEALYLVFSLLRKLYFYQFSTLSYIINK